MSGPGPAVANAVRHLGQDVRSLPITPEKVLIMRFTLNRKRADVDAPPLKRLLDVLREDCGLTGTKEGCGEGECGACTVLVDGVPVNACLVPFAHVRGREVTTIEGVRSRVPEALVREGGTQCGICTPGIVMAAANARLAAHGREGS